MGLRGCRWLIFRPRPVARLDWLFLWRVRACQLVLAGQEEHILEAYSPYYEISVAENNDGWLLLTGVRA